MARLLTCINFFDTLFRNLHGVCEKKKFAVQHLIGCRTQRTNKKYYLVLSLIFLCNWAFSQKFKDVIGPSPEVATFVKYGDIPISNYTGIPNIEIPLYSISNKEIQAPITLNYHAGGFRVDEESGRVGLGWTVNAGGVISRSVNGGDDFEPHYGYMNNSIPEFFDDQVTAVLPRAQNLLLSLDPDLFITNIAGHTVDLSPYLSYIADENAPTYDMESDIFTYNFNGISGKFSIKKNKEIVKQSPDGIDIRLLNNDGSSWLITTTEGIKYIFNKTEKCRFQAGPGVFQEYTTSWYLTKVTSPTGAEINYSYLDNGSFSVVSYNNLNEQYIFEVMPLNSAASSLNLKPSPGHKPSSYPAIKTYNPIFLSSITFPYGSLGFEYQDRIDIMGDKRLSKITVTNTFSGEDTFFYEFVQDYFTSTATTPTIPDPVTLDQNIFNKRLKLTSLVKKNLLGNIEQTYLFKYDDLSLPSKKSFSRDHWGFYNGESNSSLLPNQTFSSYKFPGQVVSYSLGGNRSASPFYCKAGMLKEIQYPTGGKTSFDFEINDYDIANSSNNLSIPSSSDLKTDTKNFITRRNLDETFFVRIPTVISGSKVIFNINSDNGQTSVWPYPYSNDAFIEIYSAQNLTTPVVRSLLGLESFWVNDSQNGGTLKYHRDDQFSLTAGDYVIKTHIGSNVSFLNYIQFSLKYSYYLDIATNHQIKQGGGLRVSKITNFDPVTNLTLIKNFGYHYNFDYDGDGIAEECSYGRRLAPLRYTTFELVGICGYVIPDNPIEERGISETFNLYSQSNIPNEEAVVAYDKVSSWEGINKNNGYTEFEYKNTPAIETSYLRDGSSTFEERPAGIPNIRYLSNGLPIKKTDYVYVSSTNLFRKQKEIISDYELGLTITQVGLRPIRVTECLSTDLTGVYFAQYPAFQSSWNRLLSQITNEYIDATSFVSTKMEYQYESSTPKHYQPVISTLTNSMGKQISTVSIYSTDYAPGTTAIDDMKAANIIVPIEQVSYSKESSAINILSGRISLFNTGGKGLLNKQYSLETTKPIPISAFKFSNLVLGASPTLRPGGSFVMDPAYKLKLTYNLYDPKGNLLSVSQEGGPKTSYLWGYNNNYPIAKIENADYYQVEALLGGVTVVNNFLDIATPTDQQIAAFLLPFKSGLNSSLITTYTYKPLIGMTRKTDPKEQTTYYEYDNFQRLKTIRDNKGDIIKNYVYHYKP